MLELLYATGIRVSELISLKVSDVNLQMEYIVCREGMKERIVPFGTVAKEALELYLEEGRPVMTDKDNSCLFTNCSGQAMSRQGFWNWSLLSSESSALFSPPSAPLTPLPHLCLPVLPSADNEKMLSGPQYSWKWWTVSCPASPEIKYRNSA